MMKLKKFQAWSSAHFGTVHGLAHLAYFAAVFVEGHGLYALMGGLLLALGVVALVWKGGAE